MILFKKPTKKLIEESIMLAIDELSNNIQKSFSDEAEKKINAESIKMLAEAYDIVHRGKAGEY